MIKSLVIFMSVFAIPIAHAPESQEHVKNNMKYTVLAIRYIGESDKPVPAVVISDSEAGAEWYRTEVLKRSKSWKVFTYEHAVSAALLKKLIEEAESFEDTVRREQEKTPGSGKDVSVTIITPQGEKTFFYDTELAISLLVSLQKHCKGDESLRSDLLKLQNRIRPL